MEMRKKQTFALMAGLVALALTGCGGGTKQIIVQQAEVAQEPKTVVDTIEAVEPIKDVLSIEQAVKLLETGEDRAAVMRKLGYKQKENYEVSRMDKYDVMYYKNCKLPRMLREGVYQNYPQPLVKGISSYVAFTDRIEIGVFNIKAYNNLVAQVKACGFKLISDGYEAEYSNGTYDIFCYEGGKRVRIQKSAIPQSNE